MVRVFYSCEISNVTNSINSKAVNDEKTEDVDKQKTEPMLTDSELLRTKIEGYKNILKDLGVNLEFNPDELIEFEPTGELETDEDLSKYEKHLEDEAKKIDDHFENHMETVENEYKKQIKELTEENNALTAINAEITQSTSAFEKTEKELDDLIKQADNNLSFPGMDNKINEAYKEMKNLIGHLLRNQADTPNTSKDEDVKDMIKILLEVICREHSELTVIIELFNSSCHKKWVPQVKKQVLLSMIDLDDNNLLQSETNQSLVEVTGEKSGESKPKVNQESTVKAQESIAEKSEKSESGIESEPTEEKSKKSKSERKQELIVKAINNKFGESFLINKDVLSQVIKKADLLVKYAVYKEDRFKDGLTLEDLEKLLPNGEQPTEDKSDPMKSDQAGNLSPDTNTAINTEAGGEENNIKSDNVSSCSGPNISGIVQSPVNDKNVSDNTEVIPDKTEDIADNTKVIPDKARVIADTKTTLKNDVQQDGNKNLMKHSSSDADEDSNPGMAKIAKHGNSFGKKIKDACLIL